MPMQFIPIVMSSFPRERSDSHEMWTMKAASGLRTCFNSLFLSAVFGFDTGGQSESLRRSNVDMRSPLAVSLRLERITS